MITAIVPAAGCGRRMGGAKNKIFLPLCGLPVFCHTAQALSNSEIDELIFAAAPQDIEEISLLLERTPGLKPWRIVAGGSERQYSIARALRVMNHATNIVVVHDGVRPLIDSDTICRTIVAARQYGAAAAAVWLKDTIKQADADDFVTATLPRAQMRAIQTPQAFRRDILLEAYRMAETDGFLGTDDASLVERLGVPVKLVEGSYRNLKITTPEDMAVAAAMINPESAEAQLRMGIGYDVHRLVTGRKLILGGVEIPHTHGLDGHSDADVLLHAIKDALLGAAAMGDIGRHFPDTDGQYRGISSLLLLQKVRDILAAKGFVACNVDATVVAQRPKLATFIAAMNRNIAEALGLNPGQINVKATTTEGLGFAGRQEGIAAYAVATISGARY